MSIISGSDLWNIIILVGAVQGFILSVLLFVGKQHQKVSNRLLATLIFLLSLACANLYITESGLYEDYAFVQIIEQVFPFIIIMPIGPLIYFYVQSLLIKDFHLQKKHRWHFYTAVIDFFPRVLVWVFIIGLLTGIVQQEEGRIWGEFIDSYNSYSDVPRWISVTVYLVLTWHFLKKFAGAPVNENVDTSIQARIKWVRQFIYAFLGFQVIWFIFLIPYINPSTRGPLLDTMSYYPIYIPLGMLVYWLGFKGYMQTQQPAEVPVAREIPLPIQTVSPAVVTSSMSFSEDEIAAYTATLKKAMECDKLYLEPSLNVQAVSLHTHIPQKTISYILNNYQDKSFNEFVNQYRIDEVKRRLLEKGNEHLTISGIAFECGFNSQATFQRAFKSITGVSPKEYLSLQTRKYA